ncbi:MAG: hypothetical protein GXO27_00840 [Chlorobi bacterium]|nr:hypothetical protein [Chlorobiota bacterium]
MLVLIWLLGTAVPAFAQDADIYQRRPGDRFEFPAKPSGMTFEEFELLETDLRMQDMMAAAIVPGYVHFRIHEKKKGWYLVGIRTLGYAGAVYLAANDKSLWRVLFDPTAKYTDKDHARNAAVAYLSAALIGGSFIYDWVHGRVLLQRKQTRIRFKYSPVIGWTETRRGQALTAGLQISF